MERKTKKAKKKDKRVGDWMKESIDERKGGKGERAERVTIRTHGWVDGRMKVRNKRKEGKKGEGE